MMMMTPTLIFTGGVKNSETCVPKLQRFDAHTLSHAVTLTFNPLTLKVCYTPSVTCSKSVRSLSKIEQSPAKLLTILRILRSDLDF